MDNESWICNFFCSSLSALCVLPRLSPVLVPRRHLRGWQLWPRKKAACYMFWMLVGSVKVHVIAALVQEILKVCSKELLNLEFIDLILQPHQWRQRTEEAIENHTKLWVFFLNAAMIGEICFCCRRFFENSSSSSAGIIAEVSSSNSNPGGRPQRHSTATQKENRCLFSGKLVAARDACRFGKQPTPHASTAFVNDQLKRYLVPVGQMKMFHGSRSHGQLWLHTRRTLSPTKRSLYVSEALGMSVQTTSSNPGSRHWPAPLAFRGEPWLDPYVWRW